jgi:hypothetical protein
LDRRRTGSVNVSITDESTHSDEPIGESMIKKRPP